MSGNIPPEVVQEALEGLINFIACEKPGQAERDKALRGLIELRYFLSIECEVASIMEPGELKD